MRALVAAAVLGLLACGRAAAQQGPALQQSLTPQEQVLLSGVLADPAKAQAFAADARAGVTAQAQQRWRDEIAVFCRDYLARPHGINASGKTVRDMVEPAEWAVLMTSLRMLAQGSLIDKAKFKIFLGRIDDANDDLKDGDASSARKLIAEARPMLAKAAQDYLATPLGAAALSDAKRKEEQAAAARAAADAKAKADAQARAQADAKAKADADAAAKAKAQAEQAAARARAQRQAQRSAPSRRAGAAAPPAPAHSALDQARGVERAARGAGTGAGSSAELNGRYDGSAPHGDSSVVDARPGAPASPAGSGLLPSSGVSVPTLTVEPPAPQQDDLAELHQMSKKVSGKKKYFAAGGGALLGGLLGFLLGGPIGAVLGAAAGGAGGFFLGRWLFG